MNRRATIRATLGAAIALAVALALLFGHDRVDDDAPVTDRAEALEPAPRLAVSERAVTSSEVERPSREQASPQPREASGSDGNEPRADPPPAYPRVAVRVLSDRGAPVEGVVVYALPAGSPGRNDEASVPHAQTGEDGTVDLWLPAPGRYDIGALQQGRALEEDVAIEGDRSLELRLRPRAEVEVSISAAAAARLGRDGIVSVKLVPLVNPALSVSFPGRNDPDPDPDWTRSAERRFRVPIPGPGEHVVSAHAPIPLRAVPERVRSGDSVELMAASYHVSVKPRFVPADRTFPERRQVRIDFALSGGATLSPQFILFPDTPVSKMQSNFTRIESPEPAGTVRWSGPGIVPGSLEFAVGPTSSFEATVDVELTDPPLEPRSSAPPPVPEIERITRMRIQRPAEAPLADTRVLFASHDDDGNVDVGGAGVDEEGVELDPSVTVVVAIAATPGRDRDRPDLVSAPTRVAQGEAIVLARGGFAVVVPVSELPSGLALRLARSDGAPFAHRVSGNSVATVGGFVGEPNAGVEPTVGMILGPLEPGVVRFAMRLGGVDAGEVEVEIRAGEYSPLVLRPNPRRVGR